MIIFCLLFKTIDRIGFTNSQSTWETKAFNAEIGDNWGHSLEVITYSDSGMLQGPNLKYTYDKSDYKWINSNIIDKDLYWIWKVKKCYKYKLDKNIVYISNIGGF